MSRTAASPVTKPHSARELARPATVPSWVTQSPPHEENASKKQSPAFKMEQLIAVSDTGAQTLCRALPHGSWAWDSAGFCQDFNRYRYEIYKGELERTVTVGKAASYQSGLYWCRPAAES